MQAEPSAGYNKFNSFPKSPNPVKLTESHASATCDLNVTLGRAEGMPNSLEFMVVCDCSSCIVGYKESFVSWVAEEKGAGGELKRTRVNIFVKLLYT